RPLPRVVSAGAQQGLLSLRRGRPPCAPRLPPAGRMINIPWWGNCAPNYLLEAFHGTVLVESNVEENVPTGFSVGPQTAQSGPVHAGLGTPRGSHTAGRHRHLRAAGR